MEEQSSGIIGCQRHSARDCHPSKKGSMTGAEHRIRQDSHLARCHHRPVEHSIQPAMPPSTAIQFELKSHGKQTLELALGCKAVFGQRLAHPQRPDIAPSCQYALSSKNASHQTPSLASHPTSSTHIQPFASSARTVFNRRWIAPKPVDASHISIDNRQEQSC